MRAVNTSAILKDVEHRPFPPPRGPWIMTQIWHELLFAHWPIAPDVLRPLVPSALPLDTFEGEAWVGIVPFRVSHAVPRWLPPVPGLSWFPEMNVRTYVTVKGIPGVYFFSLDAGNRIVVAAARMVYHLPYYHTSMRIQRANGSISYFSHRIHHHAPPAEYAAVYRPVGPIRHALSDSLEQWLTERYCLYTVVGGTRVYRANIHHKPWPLQAAELETSRNTMALAQGIQLPDVPPLLHYAHRQEVLVWPLRRVR